MARRSFNLDAFAGVRFIREVLPLYLHHRPRHFGTPLLTYKAIDVHLRCPVALKVISERYLGDESARLRLWTGVRSARDRNARLAEQRRSDRSPGEKAKTEKPKPEDKKGDSKPKGK